MPAKRPSDLIYGLDDRPAWPETFVLAFQHFIILTPRLIYPAIIVRGFNGSPALVASMVAMTMIAQGLGALMQVNRRGPLGSGFLDPPGCGAAYIYPSIQAGILGGPALVFGMTALAGLFECLFSRVFYRLRALFPPHVLGVVVTLVGLSLVKTAVTNFMGGGPAADGSVELMPNVVTGLTTLVTILSVSVWGKGKLKLYSLLVGIVVGYGMALFLGVTTWANLRHLFAGDLLALPSLQYLGWSLDPSLVVIFLIASLSTALKTSGEIVTCQKMNDSDWQHPDHKKVAGGLLADGAYTLLSGLLGGMGLSSSAANIGLCMATKATSRRIAFATAFILVALAFAPPVLLFFTNMPKPVAGASLTFVASFMVVTGIQMMTLRMLDARKTYVIGISFIFGLSVDIAPGLYAPVAVWLKPMFSSSLTLGTISAILLNALFRLGVASEVRRTLGEDGELPSSSEIFRFMEKSGAAWAARKDIIRKAASALTEVLETVMGEGLTQGPVQVAAKFDEFNLDLNVVYQGKPMLFPGQGAAQYEALAAEDRIGYLAGFLVQRMVDRVKASEQNGECAIRLHFDH